MIDVADSNTVYYYHFDGLGSVIALSDQNTDLVESYSYDVFGEPNTTSSVGNPYLFTGRRYDDESDLYYYRARYYDPQIGRFLQTDPVGYQDGLNLYAYVGNNTINSIDPSGTGLLCAPCIACLTAVAASCSILCAEDPIWDCVDDTWWDCSNKCFLLVLSPDPTKFVPGPGTGKVIKVIGVTCKISCIACTLGSAGLGKDILKKIKKPF